VLHFLENNSQKNHLKQWHFKLSTPCQMPKKLFDSRNSSWYLILGLGVIPANLFMAFVINVSRRYTPH